MTEVAKMHVIQIRHTDKKPANDGSISTINYHCRRPQHNCSSTYEEAFFAHTAVITSHHEAFKIKLHQL